MMGQSPSDDLLFLGGAIEYKSSESNWMWIYFLLFPENGRDISSQIAQNMRMVKQMGPSDGTNNLDVLIFRFPLAIVA